MILFLFIYILVYGSFHVYLHYKARSAFTLARFTHRLIVVWSVAMIAAPVLTRIFENQGNAPAARALAIVGYYWFGLVFIMVSAYVFLDVVNTCIYIMDRFGPPLFRYAMNGPRTFVSVSVIALLLWVYGYYEAAVPRVERVVLQTSKIPGGKPGLRIAQVSDLHLGHILGVEKARQIVHVLESEKPDLILATGDLLDAHLPDPHRFAEVWNAFSPPLGKYAVTGNHEYYVGLSNSIRYLESWGFELLREDVRLVGDHLEIAGVDDPAGTQTRQGSLVDEQWLFTEARDSRYRILMKHQPRLNTSVPAESSFDLQLSGHIHKGQIFPFYLAVRLFYPFPTGLTLLEDGRVIYVNRGTGTWGPPIRVLAPPEITVFDIKPLH